MSHLSGSLNSNYCFFPPNKFGFAKILDGEQMPASTVPCHVLLHLLVLWPPRNFSAVSELGLVCNRTKIQTGDSWTQRAEWALSVEGGYLEGL